jgi:hypothetical protein
MFKLNLLHLAAETTVVVSWAGGPLTLSVTTRRARPDTVALPAQRNLSLNRAQELLRGAVNAMVRDDTLVLCPLAGSKGPRIQNHSSQGAPWLFSVVDVMAALCQ